MQAKHPGMSLVDLLSPSILVSSLDHTHVQPHTSKELPPECIFPSYLHLPAHACCPLRTLKELRACLTGLSERLVAAHVLSPALPLSFSHPPPSLSRTRARTHAHNWQAFDTSSKVLKMLDKLRSASQRARGALDLRHQRLHLQVTAQR